MSPCFNYAVISETEYQVDYRQEEGKSAASPRRQRASTNRRQARPKSFNGIHRRRSKRISW